MKRCLPEEISVVIQCVGFHKDRPKSLYDVSSPHFLFSNPKFSGTTVCVHTAFLPDSEPVISERRKEIRSESLKEEYEE